MNTVELFDRTCTAIRDAAGGGWLGALQLDALINGLREVQRRDWAVKALDAWARDRDEAKPPAPERVEEDSDGRATCFMVTVPAHVLAGLDEQGGARYRDAREYFGGSEDEARYAAAEAVFDELPEDERARLGGGP